MSFARIPAWMLNQTVLVEQYNGDGAYGATYSAAVEYTCRIEPRRGMVRDRKGNVVVSSARAFFEPEVIITPESRLTWDGQQYEVIEVRKQANTAGQTHHVEVILGTRNGRGD